MTDYDLDKVREKLKDKPQLLIEHCERVREVCLKLAQRWGVSTEKAQFVALTHDIARDLSPQELLSLARRFSLFRDDVDMQHPILLHGPVAAAILKYQWGVDDEEVLEAVICHTSGCVEMSPLAKILFLADKTEEEKANSRPGLDNIRELAEKDLDRAVLEMMDRLILFHVEKKHLIHPTSLTARNHLLIKLGVDR